MISPILLNTLNPSNVALMRKRGNVGMMPAAAPQMDIAQLAQALSSLGLQGGQPQPQEQMPDLSVIGPQPTQADPVLAALNKMNVTNFTNPMAEQRNQKLSEATRVRKEAAEDGPDKLRGPSTKELLTMLALVAASGEHAGDMARGMAQGVMASDEKVRQEEEQEYKRRQIVADLQASGFEREAQLLEQDRLETLRRASESENRSFQEEMFDKRSAAEMEKDRSEKEWRASEAEKDRAARAQKDAIDVAKSEIRYGGAKQRARGYTSLRELIPAYRDMTDEQLFNVANEVTPESAQKLGSAALSTEKAATEVATRDPKVKKLNADVDLALANKDLIKARTVTEKWQKEYRREAAKWFPKEALSKINQRQFEQNATTVRLAQGWERLAQGDTRAITGMEEDMGKLEDELMRQQGDRETWNATVKSLEEQLAEADDASKPDIAKELNEARNQVAFLETDMKVSRAAIDRTRELMEGRAKGKSITTKGGSRITVK